MIRTRIKMAITKEEAKAKIVKAKKKKFELSRWDSMEDRLDAIEEFLGI